MKRGKMSRYVGLGLGICTVWSLQGRANTILPVSVASGATAQAIYEALQVPTLGTEVSHKRSAGILTCQEKMPANPPRLRILDYSCVLDPDESTDFNSIHLSEEAIVLQTSLAQSIYDVLAVPVRQTRSSPTALEKTVGNLTCTSIRYMINPSRSDNYRTSTECRFKKQ
jgi:hypothetical protein